MRSVIRPQGRAVSVPEQQCGSPTAALLGTHVSQAHRAAGTRQGLNNGLVPTCSKCSISTAFCAKAKCSSRTLARHVLVLSFTCSKAKKNCYVEVPLYCIIHNPGFIHPRGRNNKITFTLRSKVYDNRSHLISDLEVQFFSQTSPPLNPKDDLCLLMNSFLSTCRW